MRLAQIGRVEASVFGRSRCPRRKGVILMVVLSMLTLFEIVGMSFSYYSQTVRSPAVRGPFADDAHDLALHSLLVAHKIHPGLVDALQGHDLDGRTALEEIDALADYVAGVRRRIREASDTEEDPRVRQTLTDLGRNLDELQAKIALLRCLIVHILLGR